MPGIESIVHAAIAIADPIADAVGLKPNFEGNSPFPDENMNFHIYEEAERAKGPSVGIGGNWDTARAEMDFQFRIAKAQALDKAREHLIRAIQLEAQEAFPISFNTTIVSRTIDGKEATSLSEVKL